MSEIIFEKKGADFCTPVANAFLAQHMPSASGSSVKVYLYILYQFYNQACGLSLKAVADVLGMMEDDVVEALNYWQSKGLIVFERSASSCRIDFLPCCGISPDPDHPGRRCRAAHKKEAEESTKVVRLEQPPVYSPEELSLYHKNEQIRRLFSKAQEMTGGSLSIPALSTVYSFYDYYRLPIDVLTVLFDYCRENGHQSLRYAERIVQDWADHGVDSVEKAVAQTQYFSRLFPLMKALGISGRKPSEKESAIALRWLDEYKMPTELLEEAARRTLEYANKPSFAYMDRIVTDWYRNGITSAEALSALDKKPESGKPKSGFFDMMESGTDYDSLAKQAQRKLFDAMED